MSANATGLFTHDGGIQAVAANGPVSLQAHTDQLEILADKAVTIVSVNDVIEIKASEKIVLQAGQSSVTLEGGNITFASPGNFSVKSGQHIFEGGTSITREFPALPDTKIKFFNEAFVLKDPNDNPIVDIPYRIKSSSGELFSSTLEDGFSERVSTEVSESIEFFMDWFKVIPSKNTE